MENFNMRWLHLHLPLQVSDEASPYPAKVTVHLVRAEVSQLWHGFLTGNFGVKPH